MITEIKEVIIEEQTYSGSAFGVTEQGDGVFFNSRIVKTVGLKAGQTVKACLVPNFPDKREGIPWRAMRVEVTHDGLNITTQDTVPLVFTITTQDNVPLNLHTTCDLHLTNIWCRSGQHI